MKKIRTNSPITILLKEKFYVIDSDAYYYQHQSYDKGVFIIYKDDLFKTNQNVEYTESPETAPEKFSKVIPVDFLSRNLTTDDLKNLHLIECDCVKSINGLKPVNGNINLNYVKSVNHVYPVNGNVDLEFPECVKYKDLENSKTIELENGDSLSSKDLNGNNKNLIKLDGNNVIIGEDDLTLILKGNDIVFDNSIFPDLDNVLTLDDKEQYVDGTKIFKQIKVTDSPTENKHVITLDFLENYINNIKKSCTKKLLTDTTFYISLNGDDSTGDGSHDLPFRTLKRTLEEIYSTNLNNKNVSIDFLTDYYEDTEQHILKETNTFNYIEIKNTLNKKVRVYPFVCFGGRWVLDNLIIVNKKFDTCLDVCYSGIIKLKNIFFVTSTDKETDCIKCLNNGTVIFDDSCNITFKNISSTQCRSCIHIVNNGHMFGCENKDIAKNQITAQNDEGNFNTVFLLEDISKALAFDKMTIQVGENIKQYLLEDYSIFQGKDSFLSGAPGQKDSTATIL